MDFVIELLLPVVLELVIIGVLTLVGIIAKQWQNLQLEGWIKEMVIDAVLFIQEKYWQHSGAEKFDLAKAWIVERLNEKGINVSEEWIDALIDAVVMQMRAEFGENSWYRNEMEG